MDDGICALHSFLPLGQLAGSANGAELVRSAARLGALFAAGAAIRDSQRQLPFAEMAHVASEGLLAARVPRAFGGPELSFLNTARICLALAKGDPNIAQSIQPHLCLLEKLKLYASPEQQRTFFGAVMDGALITNANAERSGKVVGDIGTNLSRDGEAYRLNGKKIYSTGSLFAQYLYVTAVDKDRSRVIVIIPVGRDGVTIHDDWDASGQRTTASGTTILDNVAVSPDEVLRLPGYGSLRTHEGATAQLLHAAIDAGIALAALDDAVAYGRSLARPVPEAGVASVREDPYVLQTIGEIAVMARGAVASVEQAASILDDAAPPLLAGRPDADALVEASIASAVAKVAANNAALRASELLFQVGGANASLRLHNLDRHWRNARTHTLHDPVAYKVRMVGEFYLNDRPPPISTKY